MDRAGRPDPVARLKTKKWIQEPTIIRVGSCSNNSTGSSTLINHDNKMTFLLLLLIKESSMNFYWMKWFCSNWYEIPLEFVQYSANDEHMFIYNTYTPQEHKALGSMEGKTMCFIVSVYRISPFSYQYFTNFNIFLVSSLYPLLFFSVPNYQTKNPPSN